MTAEVGPQRTWMPADEFWKSGLLYYVNSTVLWPLGLAIAVEIDVDQSVSGMRIMRLEPAETMIDGFPDEPDHPRHRAVEFIAERIAAMSPEEQQRARAVLLDPNNVAAFLTDDPGAQSLARPDLPDGA
jgi:hypothetical protein